MNTKAQLITPNDVYPCEIDLTLQPLLVKVVALDDYDEIMSYISNISHEFKITYLENGKPTEVDAEAIYLAKEKNPRLGNQLI